MNKQTRYSPEIRERAVRMVFEHQAEYDSQWAALNSITGFTDGDVPAPSCRSSPSELPPKEITLLGLL